MSVMKIKNIFFLSFLMIFALLPAKAQNEHNQTSLEDLLVKGNAYYNENKYDTAIIFYREILKSGKESATLYYNMGNAFYKSNDYAMAILNYEKALKLNPNYDDAKQNLDMAKLYTSDKIEPMPELFLSKWWKNIVNLFDARQWTTLSLVSFAVLLIFAFFYFTARNRSLKKTMFFALIIMFVLTIIGFRASHSRNEYLSTHNEAVIIVPTTTVKSAPADNSVDKFVLHEGTKVEIQEVVDDWYKIKIANGSNGWLPSDNMVRF